MSHISTLLMNKVREGLEKLSREGVGFIDGETESKAYYRIDGRLFKISITEEKDMEGS